MARPPEYQPAVDLRPLPGVRPASPPGPRDFVGDLPEQIDRAGQMYAKMQEKAREEAESAQLMDAYAQLGRARQDVQSWVEQQQGKAALEVDLQGQAEERFQKAAQAIQTALPTERVRQAFTRQRNEAELSLRGATLSHVARQDAAFKEQSFRGALATAVDLGIQGAATAPLGQAADAKEVEAARQQLLGAIGVRMKDAPPEAREAEQRANLTALHAGALDRLLNDQRGADAERYLTRWRGEMDPAVVGKFDHTVQTVGQAAAAEGQASAIVRSAAVPGYAWTDPAKAIAAIDAIPDTDPAKPHIRQLVEQRVAVAEQLRAKAGEDKLNEARALLNQGVPLQGRQMAPLKAWMNDPKNGAAKLWDSLERNVAADAAARRAEWRAGLALKHESDRLEADRRRAEKDAAEKAAADQKARNEAALLDFQKLDLKDRAKVTDPGQAFPDADDHTRRAILIEAQKSAERVQKGQEVGYSEFSKQVAASIAGLDPEDAPKVKATLERWYWGEKDKAPEVEPGQVAVSKALADALTVMNVPWGKDKPSGALDDTRGMKPVPPEEQVYEPARRALQPVQAPAPAAPKAPAQVDVDRVQAQWKARYPGRPPLTAEQVARVLAAQGAQ